MTAFIIIAVLIVSTAVRRGRVRDRRVPRAAIDARAAKRQPAGARRAVRCSRDPAESGSLHRHRAARHHGREPRARHVRRARAGGQDRRAARAAPAPAWLPRTASPACVAIAILTYFHIVIGEMVPKSLALPQAERMAMWITPPMLWLKTLVFPLIVGAERHGQRRAAARRRATGRRRTPSSTTPPRNCRLIVQESEELGALRVGFRRRCSRSCSSSAISPRARRWCRACGSPACRWAPAGRDPPDPRRVAAHALPDLSRATSITSSA